MTTSPWSGVTLNRPSPIQPMTTSPYLMGTGPAEFSTSMELVRVPEYIWDVNGYYRELGVSPGATRSEMRLAYFEKDGQSSDRLTFVLKQLLNPETRAAYDTCVLGERFMDRYVIEEIQRQIKMRHMQRMAERRAQGFVVNETIERKDERRLWKGLLGDAVQFDDDTPEEVVDTASVVPDALASPAKVFSFAYYLWRTRIRREADIRALAEWQEHLVKAFAQKGVRTRIAVGLLGGVESPWALARVGYRDVIFLNRDEPPTAALAEKAVAEWVRTDPNPSQKR